MMSKKISMVLLISMVLGISVMFLNVSASQVQTQVKTSIKCDTFEQYIAPLPTALPNKTATTINPQYMSYYSNYGTGAVKVIATTDENSQATNAIEFSESDAGTAYMYPMRKQIYAGEMTPPNDIVFETKFKLISTSTGGGARWGIVYEDSLEKLIATWGVDSITLFANEPTPVVVSNVSKDVWHNIRIHINTSNSADMKCVEAYLDGVLISGTQNKSLTAFKQISNIDITKAFKHTFFYGYATTGTLNKMNFDDVKVYEPQPDIKCDTFEQYSAPLPTGLPDKTATVQNPQYMSYYSSYTGGAVNVISTTDENSQVTKAVELYEPSGGSANMFPMRKLIFTSEVTPTNDIVFETKFKLISTSTGGGVEWSIVYADGITRKLVNWGLANMTLFGNETTPVIISNISKDVWHTVEIHLNTNNPASMKCVEAYLDGALISGTQGKVLTAFKQINNIDTGKTFLNTCLGGYSGTNTFNKMNLDNTRIFPAIKNVFLSAILVNGATISPYFVKGTTDYTCSVASNVSTVTLTPTAEAGTSTITINGTAVTSGQPSGNIALTDGNNIITVVVTAQDTVTQQQYTVNVIKRSAPSAIVAPIVGTNTVGQNLSSSYTYQAGVGGFAESGSSIQWQYSADGTSNWTNCTGANSSVSNSVGGKVYSWTILDNTYEGNT